MLIVFSMDRFPPGGQFRIKQPEPQTTRQRNRASILCNVLHSKLFILPGKRQNKILAAIVPTEGMLINGKNMSEMEYNICHFLPKVHPE